MIPRIIHYCWFGGNQLPPLAVQCIKSWQKYCSDYKIIEWNENNFNIDYNTYVKEAYEAKKWAFVSDVARLWALVSYGGIYMDTDCELLKPIDIFLEHDAVSGFESETYIPTALMGCRVGFTLFKELLTEYDTRSFKLPNGEYDITTNVASITNKLLNYGLVLNNKKQTISGFTIYPFEYFCPKDFFTGKLNITSNTYAIHHFDGSWLNKDTKRRLEKHRHFRNRYGDMLGGILCKIYNAWDIYRIDGLNGLINQLEKKFRPVQLP